MHKIKLAGDTQFSHLNLEAYETANYSVYIMSLDWAYLYVNPFAERHLKRTKDSLLGKNMWTEYPSLAADPAFVLLKQNIEEGRPVNILTNSPVKQKRLNVVGRPLMDCYFFAVAVLPLKEEALEELRAVLKNG